MAAPAAASRPLGLVFFGSGAFAVPILERIVRLVAEEPARYRLLGDFTRPERPAGRGRKPQPTPVAEAAARWGLAAQAPASANDPQTLAQLAVLKADLFLVADYGEFLQRAFRELPPLGAWNLHGSILPKHRGAAPVARAILAGETKTGVTFFRLERELDAGPVLAVAELAISPTETAGELELRLAKLAAELGARHLAEFHAGAPPPTRPQDPAQATLAPKLEKAEGLIDWRHEAGRIANQVRALQPWPGAHSFVLSARGAPLKPPERLLILRAALQTGLEPAAGAAPGTILAADPAPGAGLVVACGRGCLRLLELQRPGKSPLAAADFLRGFALAPQDRLGGGA